MYYVYCYKHPETLVPFYIGKGKNNRKLVHLNETKENTSNYLKWCKIESLRQKGLQPIIEVLETFVDEDEAYNYEMNMIQTFGRIGFEEGGILTNRCIDNRPPTYSAKLPRSKKYLQNMSDAKKGSNNPAWGKKPWNYAKELSASHKERISKANKGRKYSIKEHESRNKTRGKTYKLIPPNNGEIIIVNNLKNWCLENSHLNLRYAGLREVLDGKNITHHGWKIVKV